MFFLRIVKQKHLFYIIVAEKCLIFKTFPVLRTAFSLCCYKHTFFSRFPHSIYRRQSLSRRDHTRRLFAARKTERRFMLWYSKSRRSSGQKSTPLYAKLAVIAIRETACCWMTLKCSAEPKCRDVAQIAAFEAEPVPLWRNTPRDKKAVCGIVQRRDTLKSLYLAAAFLYALRGASHDITSRDFVCHRSPNHSRSRLTLWGHSPQSPGKERYVWGKMFVSPSA